MAGSAIFSQEISPTAFFPISCDILVAQAEHFKLRTLVERKNMSDELRQMTRTEDATAQGIARSELEVLLQRYAPQILSLRKIADRFAKHDAERNRALTDELTALHREAPRGDFAMLVEALDLGFGHREARIYVCTGGKPDCLRYCHAGPAKQAVLNHETEETRSQVLDQFEKAGRDIALVKLAELKAAIAALRGVRERSKPVSKPPNAAVSKEHSAGVPFDVACALARLQYDPAALPTDAELSDRYAFLVAAFAGAPSLIPPLAGALVIMRSSLAQAA